MALDSSEIYCKHILQGGQGEQDEVQAVQNEGAVCAVGVGCRIASVTDGRRVGSWRLGLGLGFKCLEQRIE